MATHRDRALQSLGKAVAQQGIDEAALYVMSAQTHAILHLADQVKDVAYLLNGGLAVSDWRDDA